MFKYSISSGIILLVYTAFIFSCNKHQSVVQKNVSNSRYDSSDSTFKCNGFNELCGLRLDEVTILMTHNSYNTSQNKFRFPNQSYSVYKQLSDGVRGLMLDVYKTPKGLMLYHGYPVLGKKPLLSVLAEIKIFMTENPHEIITIIFENYCSKQDILTSLGQAGLSDLVYVHQGNWPTLKEMIDSDKRLVLFVESSGSDETEEILNAWQHIFDTRYSFSRIESMDNVTNRGGYGAKTLFLLNHWITNRLGLAVRSMAGQVNSRSVLSNRIQESYTEHQKKINFLGVDFYHIGDALSVVDSLNGVSR